MRLFATSPCPAILIRYVLQKQLHCSLFWWDHIIVPQMYLQQFNDFPPPPPRNIFDLFCLQSSRYKAFLRCRTNSPRAAISCQLCLPRTRSYKVRYSDGIISSIRKVTFNIIIYIFARNILTSLILDPADVRIFAEVQLHHVRQFIVSYVLQKHEVTILYLSRLALADVMLSLRYNFTMSGNSSLCPPET